MNKWYYVNALTAFIPALYIAYICIIIFEKKYKVKLFQSFLFFCVFYVAGYIMAFLILCIFSILRGKV